MGCGGEVESLVPALIKEGVMSEKGSAVSAVFDEIVCVRVLCGVPEQQAMIEGFYGLLKPGGRMVVCEHVINSGDSKKGGTVVGRALQYVYMSMAWSPLIGGCELTRDTMTGLLKAAEKDGGWEKVDLQLVDGYSCLPHIVGTLVKKR